MITTTDLITKVCTQTGETSEQAEVRIRAAAQQMGFDGEPWLTRDAEEICTAILTS
jgi:hypothetical protein